MALLRIQPFLSPPPPLSKLFTFSLLNNPIPKQTPRRRYNCKTQLFDHQLIIQSKKQQQQPTKCHAAVIGTSESSVVKEEEEEKDETVLLGQSGEEVAELRGERVVADYDWTEEWYPLYLAKDIPDDAPLGLTVFDKQVVLYRDGNGDIHCYQDRCPHR